jgi:phenylacetate-CoA ligase
MQRFLHRHILLPAFETGFKRRRTFRIWKELEASQWLSRPELQEQQLIALRNLLCHAFVNCPYYQEVWLQHGLNPRKVHSFQDFERWPIIDRDTIRAHRLKMRAGVPGMRMLSKSTGGSSGAPLHFDLDTGSHERRTAAWHRGYAWAGAEPGTKQLYLWGIPLGRRTPWQRWKDALYNRLHRRLVLNSFELSDERAVDFLHKWNRYRPDVVVAYTNPLYSFARILAEHRLQPSSPRSLIVGAEKLYPFQRELIEDVFGAPVFETYGCREVMLIGGECDRHEGFHLTHEHLLVEVLGDNGRPAADGEEGSVVLTDLFNYGMPFVRYANGDRAIAGWGRCSCGRGLPLLRQVVGRQLDMLRTPDGRQVPGEFFPHLLKDFPAVRRFQVVQLERDRVQLRLVIKGNWTESDRCLLEEEARAVLGPRVRLELRPVNDIPLSGAGKFQVVVNQCATSPLRMRLRRRLRLERRAS